MRYLILLCLVLSIVSCKPSEEKTSKENTTNESEASDDLSDISTKDFREFKVLDSKYINTSELWDVFNDDLKDFTGAIYNELKPLVLDQDIPTIQKHIR